MTELITNDKTPLGASFNETTKCVEFRLYSKSATVVKLCIFDKPQNEPPAMELDMKKGKDDIWYTSVKDYILNCTKRPVYYGFRLWGQNWEYKETFEEGTSIGFISKFDEKGNRFNPNKIAFDPYCQELTHLVSDVNPGNNMFRSGGNFYVSDNAKCAIKSVFFPKENISIQEIEKRPFINEIIGEVHIKDLTQNVKMQEHGTYKGAGKFAKSIKDLGITMVEFLPINEFDSKQAGGNHWGYMPLGYFTLARKYAYNKSFGNLLNEFRLMIDEFHNQGIKVCLDMVYNHTGEGGLCNHDVEDANLLSYALIDNATYYKTYKNGYYRSNSGCGNDFKAQDEGVLNLIADSLAFWAKQGVDAFRFDLAAALLECNLGCEEIYGDIDTGAYRLKEKLKERNVKVIEDFETAQEGIVLIAEPWTCGGRNCYQLGNFPSYWGEWNDKSRDIIRKITLRQEEVTPRQIREIFEGSPDIFNNINKSINYIASHDGFCLYDLNNFTRKSSSTSGGSDYEISGDYGGDLRARENAIRKQLAFLFLSRGIPMIQIGDIIMHTKNGNNNSYNKDDATNYLNWDKIIRKGGFENRIMEYVRNLIKFRNENSIFKNKDFIKRVSYHYDNAEIADDSNTGYWNNPMDVFFGALLDCENRIYIASNKSNSNLNIFLPKKIENRSWHICMDTSNFQQIDFESKDYIERNYILSPNALAIFIEE